MTLLVDNRLNGEPGTPVSDSNLAATADIGAVTVLTPGSRAAYDTTHTVYDLPTIRVDTGHHRLDTPRLVVGLPEPPWCVRWYVWHPSLQAAGYGTDEVRWLARVNNSGLVGVEVAAGFYTGRFQPAALVEDWAIPLVAGTNQPVGQWLRMEVRHSGNGLTQRVYDGHDPDDHRSLSWSSANPQGSDLQITGYRYRRRPTLQWGDQGSDVTALQQELIDLEYDLGPWGADGGYGDMTYFAVQEFQGDYGLVPVDGVAGPETRAAIDLALGRVPPPLWLSHLAVSDGEWIGPAEAPPDPEPHVSRLVVGIPI